MSSAEQCPVCRIKADNEQGYIVINQSDFVEGEHAYYDEDVAPEDKEPTIAYLREQLTAAGIDFNPASKKKTLQALLAAGKQPDVPTVPEAPKEPIDGVAGDAVETLAAQDSPAV